MRARLREHSLGVQSVAFSADGKLLASGSRDKTIILWDVATGQSIGRLPQTRRDAVNSLAFGPDSKKLVSGGRAGTVASGYEGSPLILWDVSGDSWRYRACEIAGRNLTAGEWQQYAGEGTPQMTCPREILREAVQHARQAETNQAASAFERLAKWAISTSDANLNNETCWTGSIERFEHIVLPACERAVSLAVPDSMPMIRDSRGLARALMGDYRGAIDDFRVFVEWARSYPDLNADLDANMVKLRHRREHWIAELEAERNPFDVATLRALRTE